MTRMTTISRDDWVYKEGLGMTGMTRDDWDY